MKLTAEVLLLLLLFLQGCRDNGDYDDASGNDMMVGPEENF